MTYLEELGLEKARLNELDLARMLPLIAEFNKPYFCLEAGKEHYRLLAHLSDRFAGNLVLDIGTNRGASAVALSRNPKTKVVSYDIVDVLETKIKLRNLKFRVRDVLKDPKNIIKAKLILLDTAHDGTFENIFFDFLVNHSYKGYLLLDDIWLNDPMKEFWNSIAVEKYDLSEYGHWSGTGLVVFR